jgi:Sec-independent protein secretion pathway component TatC
VIGVTELLATLPFGAGGGAALILLIVLSRRGGESRPVQRAPLPVVAVVLAALTIPAGLLASLGLGGLFVESLLLPPLAHTGQLVVSEPRAPSWAHLHASGLLAVWLALPGLLALGVLLVSRRRSWVFAGVLAAGGWLGFGIGVAAGLWLLPPAVVELAGGQLPGATVSLVHLVDSLVSGLMAFGVAGGCGPIVALLAARSWPALRRMLIATVVMPAGALLVAALATPPDIITQLLVAVPIGASWLAGLATGAVVVALRRRRRQPRCVVAPRRRGA